MLFIFLENTLLTSLGKMNFKKLSYTSNNIACVTPDYSVKNSKKKSLISRKARNFSLKSTPV